MMAQSSIGFKLLAFGTIRQNNEATQGEANTKGNASSSFAPSNNFESRGNQQYMYGKDQQSLKIYANNNKAKATL